MKSKLKSLKDLYTALGGNSASVLGANSVIAVLNGILALGSVDGCQFVPDAIKAIADNLSSIDPSSAATLIEKIVTENGVYNASDDEADGYSKVTVSLEPGVPEHEIVITYNEMRSEYESDVAYGGVLAAIEAGNCVKFYLNETLLDGWYVCAIPDVDLIMIPYESGYVGDDETLSTTFFLMYPDSHIELVTLAMAENPNQ